MSTNRRLAAIMFTDMVGSTASAQADEAGALKLRDEQAALVRPLFAAHQGREIKSMGDGFLAEFDSALRAVQCGIDIQQHLNERNAEPGVTPIQLRIGIHLGDVEQRETDIFGDAVNIASRIEPLASPGGVCISGEVFSQIRNKLPNRFEKLPPTVLRGVQASMDLYRVVLPWTAPEGSSVGSGPTRLAVLPFANISPDPKDEYIADGLTEELIATVSQLRPLTVIARTSVVPYKGAAKSVSQIASELGVGTVLEGSVRRVGNRIRVTAQLIDARTQGHLWTESYDRDLDDLLAIQTGIAQQVARSLQVELVEPSTVAGSRRAPVRADSYLAYLRGRTLLHGTSHEARSAAQAQFERAIALDPNNAAAHSGLADVIRISGWRSTDVPRAVWHAKGRELALRAIELDPDLAEAHASLALVLWDNVDSPDYPGAEAEFRRSLALNPSYSLAHMWYGGLLEEEARADEALRELRLAEAADPIGSEPLHHLARLLTNMGRHEEALSTIERFARLDPESPWGPLARASHYRALGDASRAAEEYDRAVPLVSGPEIRLIVRAMAASVRGERTAAADLLREAEAGPGFPQVAPYAATAYADLGDLDRCFRALDLAFQNGILPMQQFQLAPELASVRRDPRYAALVTRLRIPSVRP